MSQVVLLPTAERTYRRFCSDSRELFERVDAALRRLTTAPQAGQRLAGRYAAWSVLRVGLVRIIACWDQRHHTLFIYDIAQQGSRP